MVGEGDGLGFFDVICVNGIVGLLCCEVFDIFGSVMVGMVGDFEFLGVLIMFLLGDLILVFVSFLIFDDVEFEGNEGGFFEVEGVFILLVIWFD